MPPKPLPNHVRVDSKNENINDENTDNKMEPNIMAKIPFVKHMGLYFNNCNPIIVIISGMPNAPKPKYRPTNQAAIQ